jgi:hypothetical protein
VRRRRTSRELPEVAHEVRLIGVTTFSRSPRHGRLPFGRVEQLQRVLEPRDARQSFWRDPDVIQKPSFEMPPRDVCGSRHPVNRHLTARTRNQSNRLLDPRIQVGRVYASQKDVLHSRNREAEIVGAVADARKFRPESRVQIVEPEWESLQSYLRHRQQRSRSVRVEPHADNRDASGRTQQQPRGQLTGEQDRGLLDGATRLFFELERLPEVQDELGAPVGQDRVAGGARLCLPFERPDPFDHIGQAGQRWELTVLHRGIVSRRQRWLARL